MKIEEKVFFRLKWLMIGLLVSIAVVILYFASFDADSPAVWLAEILFGLFGIAVVFRLSSLHNKPLDNASKERPSQLTSRLKKPVIYLICILALVLFFVFSYRDILSIPGILIGTDINVPGVSSTYHLIGLVSPWRPYSLGYYSSPGDIGGLISAAVVIFSNGSQALAQKFYYLCIPLASILMFFFLQRYVSKNYLVSVFGAIIFCISPVISGNFSSIANWGFALIPLFYICLIEFLKPGRRLLYSVLLAISLLLLYTWHPNFLAIMPFVIVIPLLLGITRAVSLKRYIFDKAVGLLLFGFLFFLFTYPSFAWDNLITGGAQYSFSVVRAPPSNQFIINYANFSHLNLLLDLESYPIYLNAGASILGGLLIPAMALMAVVIKPKIFTKEQSRLYKQVILGCSLIILLICLYVAFLHVADSNLVDLVVGLYKPLVFLRSPLTILFEIAFCFAVLSTFTLDNIIKNAYYYFEKWSGAIRSYRISSKHKTILGYFLIAGIMISIFATVFSFTPVFSSSFRALSSGKNGFYENDPVYVSALTWLTSQDNFESFRSVILPTWPVSILNLANSDPYTLSFSDAVSPYSVQSISDLFNAIVDTNSTSLSTLLGLANVKYVIVTTGLNDSTRNFYLSGPPRVYGDDANFPNFIIGDPDEFLVLMQNRTDFVLEHQDGDLYVFENLNYIPRMVSYSQCITIDSNKTIMRMLPKLPLPNEIAAKYALINYESQKLNNLSLNLSSTIINDNPDLCSSKAYSELNYSIPIISSFDTDSSSVKHQIVKKDLLDTSSIPEVVFGSGDISLAQVSNPYWSITGKSDEYGRLSIDVPLTSLLEDNFVIPVSINNSEQLSSFSVYLLDSNYKVAKWDYTSQLRSNEGWQTLVISLDNCLNSDHGFNFSNVVAIRFEPIGGSDSLFSYYVGVPYMVQGYECSFDLILPRDYNVTIYLDDDSVKKILTNGIVVDSIVDSQSGWISTNELELSPGSNTFSILSSTDDLIDVAVFVNTSLKTLVNVPSSEAIAILDSDISSNVFVKPSKNQFVVFGDSYDIKLGAESTDELAAHYRANDYANCFIFKNDSTNFRLLLSGLNEFTIGVISKIGSFITLTLFTIFLLITKKVRFPIKLNQIKKKVFNNVEKTD